MMREIFDGLKSLASITKSVEGLEKKMDRMLDGMEGMRSELRDVDKRVVRLEEARDSTRADVRASLMQDLAQMFVGLNNRLSDLEGKYSQLKVEVERVSRKSPNKKRRMIP